jgi:hypothetical protein
MSSKLLERNLEADIREGWGLSRHQIAVPEPMFVQEMRTIARERFGGELDQLTSQTQVAIEAEVSDPVRWSGQANYHAQDCPACSESSSADETSTT